jgi:hypothetical protein
LRRSSLGRKESAFLHVSGFQPSAQQTLVHRNVLLQPMMVDMIETSFDITFENPLR